MSSCESNHRVRCQQESLKQFTCDFCGKSFNKPSLLIRHNSRHLKTSNFKCQHCKKTFSQNVTLQKHLKASVCIRRKLKQLNEPTLDEPNIESDSKRSSIPQKHSELDHHLRPLLTEDTRYECDREGCVKSFKFKKSLEKHLTTHERQDFICTICLSAFKSEKVLNNHVARLHSQIHIIELLKDKPLTNDFVVIERVNEEITDKKSIPLSDLLHKISSPPQNDTPPTLEINQIEIGNEEIVESRDEIDEQAEINVSLRKSLRTNEFVCRICSKRFNKPIDLRRHSDAVHEKKRPFICSIADCDKSFSLKCTLQRHLETHKVDRKVVTCKVCEKTLSSASSLKFHERIHEDLKPHQCSTCLVQFRTPGNLKSHRKTHINSKSNFMAS